MNARLDLGRPGIARYVQLATLFRRRIETGEWRVGEQIPTLEELVRALGVARATVRQALGELEADGLLERYRAKGTFVTRRPAAPHAAELATDWSSLSRAHELDTIELLASSQVARPPFPVEPPQGYAPAYQYLRRRHLRDAVPYLLGHVYLDARVYRKLSRKDVESMPMLRALKETDGIGIANAHQTLVIGTADVETATALGMAINSPLAVVHRTAFDRAGTLIYYSLGLYRGDYVRLEIALK